MPSFNQKTTIQEIAAAYPGAIEGRTYLITGATTAMVLDLQRFFNLNNFRLAKAVEEVKSNANPKTIIKTLILDLESHDSVRRAADQITSGALGIPKIDILLNNAGIMAVPYKKIDGYEQQFFCNHLSHFLFTNLIISQITSPGERIINASSGAHRRSPVRFDDINFKDGDVYNKWQAYGQSKTANILFSKGLNKRINESKGIESFSVHPGAIMTGLANHLDLEAEGFLDKDGKLTIDTITIEQGIATYLYASLSPELNGKGGSYLTESQIKDTAFPMTEGDAERLWELSNSILGTGF
ncbi:short-chain dehydrogenase [Cyathus striatus]|nr:short-chain dehydrogenase [Cyathus striatus]